MLHRKAVYAAALSVIWLCSLPGCGWCSSDEEVEEDPVSLAEDSPDDSRPVRAQQKIELRLKPGDRFPLIKTVEHTLRQPTEQGWSISKSKLEMLLSVTVREIRPMAETGRRNADPRAGEKLLEVQYHRVRFSQELPGRKKVEYNSDAPVSPVPLVAAGYHGLKDNGFEFWVNKDNQIVEIVAFDQFLDRCLKEVPANKQKQVRTAMAATSGADGIANFVDDSIGLLPTSAVREGDSWTRDRQILQPVPMHSNTRYVLRRMTDEVAEIDLVGTLSSLITNFTQENKPEVDVSIRGGQSIGNCLIDRRTGLPLQTKIDQSLDMLVKLPNGSEFEQHKTTVTTVRYFPGQNGVPAPSLDESTDAASDVVHASAEQAPPRDARKERPTARQEPTTDAASAKGSPRSRSRR